MSVAMGLGIVQQGFGMFAKYKQNREATKNYKLELEKQKRVAASSLATTYNTIIGKSHRAFAEMRRAEFKIRADERKMAGEMVASAAHRGATGRRVQLARAQATEGAADRALGTVGREGKAMQDALINEADAAAKNTVNRLISGAPDVPSGFDPLVTGLQAGISVYGEYLDEKAFQDKRKADAAKE